jgi:hypothetical protein
MADEDQSEIWKLLNVSGGYRMSGQASGKSPNEAQKQRLMAYRYIVRVLRSPYVKNERVLELARKLELMESSVNESGTPAQQESNTFTHLP